MKTRKQLLALVLAAVLLLSLAACDGGKAAQGADAPAPLGADSEGPRIRGVHDLRGEAGEEIWVLDGVEAFDAAGNDLTDQLSVESVPALDFRDGKTVPAAGGVYDLYVSVTDGNGQTERVEATLTVAHGAGDAELLRSFDFSDPGEADDFGWEARIGGSAKADAAIRQGAYIFEISDPGKAAEDVQLALPGFQLTRSDYRVRIWAKSTADIPCSLQARDESAEAPTFLAESGERTIGAHVTPVEISFTSEGKGSAELLLNLGGGSARDCTVTIDKIELYRISGDETMIPVFAADFTAEDAIRSEAGDGAVASVSAPGEFTISSYPNGGGVWSIRCCLGLGDQTIEEGQSYYYSFTVNAENGLSGEALLESLSRYQDARVDFRSLSGQPGEDVTVTAVFTADREISDPVVRLQIGTAPGGATENKLVFKDLSFGRVEGNKIVRKTVEQFSPYGYDSRNATNPLAPWTCFNGTDDENARGVGTIWAENGSFFYRMDDIGTVDWHNKLSCGFRENPLTLPAGRLFKVDITMRADKYLFCGIYLNPIGKWEPKIAENVLIVPAAQTFSFITSEPVDSETDFELLFQFGSEINSVLGSATVEIVDLSIYEIPVG